MRTLGGRAREKVRGEENESLAFESLFHFPFFRLSILHSPSLPFPCTPTLMNHVDATNLNNALQEIPLPFSGTQ